QGLRTGQAVTIYEWNGMRREDKADQTSEIDIPAKNERILLNLATKTYEIIDESQQQAEPEESMGPMPTMPPMNSPPPMKPGTAVVFITTTTTDLGPKILDNMPTEGYRVTSNIKWTQATGSCKGEDFQAGGEWVQFFSTYSEPTLAPRPMPKVTMPAALPSMPALPSLQSLKNAMATGCKPIVKASIQRGVHIPYNRMVVWQFFGASAQMPNQDQQQEGQESMQTLGALSGNPNGPPGFGFLIERGSVKVLGPSAASLFKVPAGFTQGKVMQ
ncbi:MAG TPA: hypothetical protein VEJ41_08890, partial [Candidatus Acidoferrales bacterium]|nr:hypothetical protein [Candidatus Acidoferrales bacterium]